MIDFAHAVPVDGDGELGEGPAEAPGDKGYLYGAKNVSVLVWNDRFGKIGIDFKYLPGVLSVVSVLACVFRWFVRVRIHEQPAVLFDGLLNDGRGISSVMSTWPQFPVVSLTLVSPLRACVRADECSLLASWRSCWR